RAVPVVVRRASTLPEALPILSTTPPTGAAAVPEPQSAHLPRPAGVPNPPSSLPLAGVRVLALEQAVARRLCTRTLADLGADVIKVERPGEGDFARAYDTIVDGLATWWVWLNGGKRSIAVDLKDARSRRIVHELAARADVVVQNF